MFMGERNRYAPVATTRKANDATNGRLLLGFESP
jgi:hypothetical protein